MNELTELMIKLGCDKYCNQRKTPGNDYSFVNYYNEEATKDTIKRYLKIYKGINLSLIIINTHENFGDVHESEYPDLDELEITAEMVYNKKPTDLHFINWINEGEKDMFIKVWWIYDGRVKLHCQYTAGRFRKVTKERNKRIKLFKALKKPGKLARKCFERYAKQGEDYETM